MFIGRVLKYYKSKISLICNLLVHGTKIPVLDGIFDFCNIYATLLLNL